MKWLALHSMVLVSIAALLAAETAHAQVLDKGKVTPVSHNEKKRRSKAKQMNLDDVELDVVPAEAAPTPLPAVEVVPPATRAALIRAEALEKLKDYAGVIRILKPLLDTIPRKGLLQIARAYRSINDSVNEIHALELVIAKNPKDYVAQTELGNAYFKAKRYEDAGTAFQTARTLNNKYRPAFDGTWTLLEKSDSKYEARTLLLDMIKTFGPDAKMTAAVCRMYSGEDFLEKAVEACHKAIETDPKNPDNYVHLAKSLRDQDHKAEAQKVIEDAAKSFSKSEDVQALAGDLRAADKNFADAYRYYKQAVVADPKSVRAQTGFARTAFELQKHGEAIAAFKAACRLDKKTGREFRSAYLELKNHKDESAHLYESELDACN